jgi:hypothetical protein
LYSGSWPDLSGKYTSYFPFSISAGCVTLGMKLIWSISGSALCISMPPTYSTTARMRFEVELIPSVSLAVPADAGRTMRDLVN